MFKGVHCSEHCDERDPLMRHPTVDAVMRVRHEGVDTTVWRVRNDAAALPNGDVTSAKAEREPQYKAKSGEAAAPKSAWSKPDGSVGAPLLSEMYKVTIAPASARWAGRPLPTPS